MPDILHTHWFIDGNFQIQLSRPSYANPVCQRLPTNLPKPKSLGLFSPAMIRHEPNRLSQWQRCSLLLAECLLHYCRNSRLGPKNEPLPSSKKNCCRTVTWQLNWALTLFQNRNLVAQCISYQPSKLQLEVESQSEITSARFLEIPGSSKMRFNPSSALLLIERPARPALMKSVHVVSIKTWTSFQVQKTTSGLLLVVTFNVPLIGN